MPSRKLFTLQLLSELKKQGFTHMQLRGVEKNTGENKFSDNNVENYILVARKQDFTLFEETDFAIEPIDSTDISDMLNVEFGINFWVEFSD